MEKPLTASQRNVLAGLARLAYATNRQLARFAYAESSYTLITVATKGLLASGYIGETLRVLNPPEKIFYLTAKGRKYLLACDYEDVPEVPKNVPTTWLFQEHTHALNDLSLRLAVREPGWSLETFLPDRLLKRDPIRVETHTGMRTFIPDAWCVVRLADATERAMLFEVDRATEGEGKWREKVQTILWFYRGGAMVERFGTDRCTIAVTIPPLKKGNPAERVQQLMDWTRRELAANRAEAGAGLFLFTTADPATTPSRDYLFGPVWTNLADNQPTALIPQ